MRCERLEAPLAQAEFTALVNLSRGPHPGPVVIEVCLDVQGSTVDDRTLAAIGTLPAPEVIVPDDGAIGAIGDLFARARRPLVLLGGLVSRDAAQQALPVFERLGLPVATTTSAIDRIPTGSPVFAGRPGTWGGQRAANLVVAQADLVLALGAQLDLQQTGFNAAEYAPRANLIHVFPSQPELDRAGPPASMKLCATPDMVLAAVLAKLTWEDRDGWADYVRGLRKLVPALEPGNVSRPGFINSFAFFAELSRATDATDILALCSSGGTFTGALQTYEVARGQVATTSPAHASMGYGLATAIGAAFGSGGRRVILTEGEGGFSQNLQELATVKRHALPIKLFLTENGGYASIRATQRKFFNGAYLGCDPATGLGFPDWELLFGSYGIACRYLQEDEINEVALRNLIEQTSGPEAWIVRVDPDQPNWPAVATRLLPDGSMTSSPLYDMLPPLPDAILAKVGRYLPGQSGGD